MDSSKRSRVARATPPDQIQVLPGALLWYSGRRLRENVAVRDYARFYQGEFGTQYVVNREKDTRHWFQWLDWFRGRRAFRPPGTSGDWHRQQYATRVFRRAG